MKKDILLEIHIDTEREGASRLETHPEDARLKRILVLDDAGVENSDGLDNSAPDVVRAKLLHELGHLVSEIMTSDGAQGDPRKGFASELPTSLEKLHKQQRLVQASEEEAWVNADAMLKEAGAVSTPGYDATKKVGLDSYRKARPEQDRLEIENARMVEVLSKAFHTTPEQLLAAAEAMQSLLS